MSVDLSRVWTARQYQEKIRYDVIYSQHPSYAMGAARAAVVRAFLFERPDLRGTYLDVSCGRGESLVIARDLGYAAVHGTEIVDALLVPDLVFWSKAHELECGDESYQTVSSFDVLEHLVPGDDEYAVLEMGRVGVRRLLFTIGMTPSADWGEGELHINLKPEEDWTRDLTAWLPGWKVARRADRDCTQLSCAWEATR